MKAVAWPVADPYAKDGGLQPRRDVEPVLKRPDVLGPVDAHMRRPHAIGRQNVRGGVAYERERDQRAVALTVECAQLRQPRHEGVPEALHGVCMELDGNCGRLPRQAPRRPWRAAILPMAAPGRKHVRVEAKEAEGVRIVPEAGEPWLLRLNVLVQPFH